MYYGSHRALIARTARSSSSTRRLRPLISSRIGSTAGAGRERALTSTRVSRAAPPSFRSPGRQDPTRPRRPDQPARPRNIRRWRNRSRPPQRGSRRNSSPGTRTPNCRRKDTVELEPRQSRASCCLCRAGEPGPFRRSRRRRRGTPRLRPPPPPRFLRRSRCPPRRTGCACRHSSGTDRRTARRRARDRGP